MNEIQLREELFEGAVSFQRGDGWMQPWRLRFDELALHPNPGLQDRASEPSGVRLRFATTGGRIALDVEPHECPRTFDLTIDGELVDLRKLPAGGEEVVLEAPGDGERIVELWLAMDYPVRIRGLRADGEVRPVTDDRPRWVTYGSSITHCKAAHSPARTWPATAARARGLNLTSLGFGGNCHMEPLVAMTIRDLPAEVITLKVGINIQGQGSLGPRTFREALIGMVRIIREKHPDTPMAVVSPIMSPPRETAGNAVGLSLTAMREMISDAVERLIRCGDGNLRYVNGLALFSEQDIAAHAPDQLHPDGDGYEILGRNFVREVLDKLPPLG